MSHWHTAQEKAFPRISLVAPDEQGAQPHYCTASRKRVGLRLDGRVPVRRLFCPLCGVLVTADPVEHDRSVFIELVSYDGPRCIHGRPDLRCLDVSENESLAQLQLAAGSVRAYAAARLAARYGCAAAVADWVRVCPPCRDDIAAKNRPLLRHELRLLAQRLADELRTANSRLQDLAAEADELQSLIRDLDAAEDELSANDAPLGFVYLIAARDAVKIGYSQRHPAESRLGDLQIASPDELRLAGLILGDVNQERQLQRRFAKYRIRGEWFANSTEILEYFRIHGLNVS